MTSKKQFVKLDELASGRLPNRIVQDISRMTLTTSEVVAWEQSKPDSHFSYTDGVIRIKIDKQFSFKKLLTILGSVIGTIWVVVQFAVPYFT